MRAEDAVCAGSASGDAVVEATTAAAEGPWCLSLRRMPGAAVPQYLVAQQEFGDPVGGGGAQRAGAADQSGGGVAPQQTFGDGHDLSQRGDQGYEVAGHDRAVRPLDQRRGVRGDAAFGLLAGGLWQPQAYRLPIDVTPVQAGRGQVGNYAGIGHGGKGRGEQPSGVTLEQQGGSHPGLTSDARLHGSDQPGQGTGRARIVEYGDRPPSRSGW